MTRAAGLIDTHPQRNKIIEQILAGVGCRDIATWVTPKVSWRTIQRYSSAVVKPAARAATIPQSISIGDTSVEAMLPDKALARDMARSSPVRERVQFLWEKTQRGIDQAAAGVRESRSSDGEQVFMAQDLSALAPLINQGHKNVELLGKLTGELRDEQRPGLTINIVCPGDPKAPRIDLSSPDAIDIE